MKEYGATQFSGTDMLDMFDLVCMFPLLVFLVTVWGTNQKGLEVVFSWMYLEVSGAERI